MKTAESPEEENSPQVETQEPEEKQKEIAETEHNEISRESESPAAEEDVADIPTEEHTPETINVQSDALPLEHRVDTAAEVVTDDVPIADDVEEGETADLDMKEPEEKVVNERNEAGMYLNYYELISSGT